MLYLNKLLTKIKENPALFKSSDIIITLGLTLTDIKNLKKYALENQLITQSKHWYFLTEQGEKYLLKNPLVNTFNLDVNIEYLKEKKTPAVLTKAIRLVAKHLIEKQELKEMSVERALFEDIKNCKALIALIEAEILDSKRTCLEKIYEKYLKKGFTKSIISLIILMVLTNNFDRIAIYEKMQFQLNFDALMFDRMIACPQNFEIQKTEMPDEYLLKDVSKIILNKTSNNILEITKGLYSTIKSLDKYAMNTQNLSQKTLRFRNVIVNAKDPISLFGKDIPKVLSGKELKDCDRDFLNNLKTSLEEIENCTENLVNELKKYIFNSFKTKSKQDLCNRFLEIKEFINEKELKILFNNVIEINVSDNLWVNRIATFINKSRVPKDWNDEDVADFKIKIKELALKIFIIETTVGSDDKPLGRRSTKLLKEYLELSKIEQLGLLRKMANG